MVRGVSLYGLSMKGGIMIGSSGGVIVGALVCGTECSGFKSRFMLLTCRNF